MLKRSLLVLGLVGCMSAFASAQVFVEYWPQGDAPDGVNDKFDILQGETVTLNIGVTGGDGSLLMAGGDFNFSWPAGSELTNFQWDSQYDALVGWFPDNTLPAPAVSSFFPSFPIPAGPDPQLALATVDLTIDALAALGPYKITTGPTVNNEVLSIYNLGSGSDSISFNVIPEPATMVLLALGGITALRRRRS